MYASRWLLAPGYYFGLSLALMLWRFTKIFGEFYTFCRMFCLAEADLITVLLSLVGMTLVGGFMVMVMFCSGYENFVSHWISLRAGEAELAGKMDATSLKNKVAASIVAISSIHLLRVFMDAKTSDNKLMWYVIIHRPLCNRRS